MRNFKLIGNQKNESTTPIKKKRSLGEIVCYNPNGAIPHSRQHASNLRKPQFSSLPFVFNNQRNVQTLTRNGHPRVDHNTSSSNLHSLGQQKIPICFVLEAHGHLVLWHQTVSWTNAFSSQVTSPPSLTLTQTSGPCRASTAWTGGRRTNRWKNPRPQSRPHPSPRPSPGLRGSRGSRLDPWTPTLLGTHCRGRRGNIVFLSMILGGCSLLLSFPASVHLQHSLERSRSTRESGSEWSLGE